MSFLEPLFLVGLLAAGLPLLVHLFNRRKAVRREFPALALLMESNKRTARSIKVRQWLLMALRIGALALLALAMAKPFCLSEQGVTSAERMPTAVVFVVDTSSSMQYGQWSERAKDALSAQLKRLRPWDEAALLETSRGEFLVDRLTHDHDKLEDALSKLQRVSTSGDSAKALLRAKELVLSSQLVNRKIVLISDMAKGGFRQELLPQEGFGVPLELVNVREGDAEIAPENIGITEVNYTQEGSAQEQLWRIDATLYNFGTKPARDVELRLSFEGQLIAAGKVELIEPGASVAHVFRHRYDSAKPVSALVEIERGDAYAPDNSYHFVFRPRTRIRALVVNGEPNGVTYDDEVFFLTRALNPKRSSKEGIVPATITIQGLMSAQLKDYDVVFLANVPRVSQEQAAKLEAYVRDGGGLMVSMGDQVDVDAYNMTMSGLLPRSLRSLKRLTDRDDPDAPIKLTNLGATDLQHPVFKAFMLPGGQTLQSVQVYSYMLLEPTATEQTKTLISYKDDAPALLERSVGKGRVMLLTTTLDYEWTDFPIGSTYLPLLHRVVLYLARRATSRGAQAFVVGQPSALELAGLVKERLILQADAPGAPRHVLEITDEDAIFVPDQVGVYKAWAEQIDEANPDTNRIEDLSFAVNSPPEESDLEQLKPEQLEAWRALPPTASAQAQALVALDQQRRINLWPKLLFVITLLLLLETVLGTRRAVLRRLFSWATRPTARAEVS